MRARVGLVGLALLAACADAHPAPVRCLDGVCPDGQVCLADEGSVCVARCDATTETRCENGAACFTYRTVDVCWPGRAVADGSIATVHFDCAFGLRSQPDYESEPLRDTCEPVCDRDADCRSGEVCWGTTCHAPCRSPDGASCAPTSQCVSRIVCVNERRFARVDCDGDGAHDCTLGLMCDPEDPTRCIHVPAGEE